MLLDIDESARDRGVQGICTAADGASHACTMAADDGESITRILSVSNRSRAMNGLIVSHMKINTGRRGATGPQRDHMSLCGTEHDPFPRCQNVLTTVVNSY